MVPPSARCAGLRIRQTHPNPIGRRACASSVVVEHRREGCVHIALRLSIAEPISHWPGEDTVVEFKIEFGPVKLVSGGVAETAGLVLVDLEVFIEGGCTSRDPRRCEPDSL